MPGCGERSHSASIAATPRRAAALVAATTPMNSPSRTTLTPGSASAGAVSAPRSVAPNAGGRSTQPCSMPSARRSAGNRLAPVTTLAPPAARAGWPAERQAGGGVTGRPGGTFSTLRTPASRSE